MIIAHFLSSLDKGGAQRVVSELLRRMAQDHEVHLLLKRRKPQAFEVPAGIVVEELDLHRHGTGDSGLIENLRVILRTVGYLKQQHIELLISHTNRNNVLAVLASKLACTKVVVVEHTVSGAFRSRLWRLFRMVTYPLANSVVVLSSDQRDKYPLSRVRVIPNPLPTIALGHPPPESTPKETPNGGPLRLLYAGRLEKVKRIHLLISICRLLHVPYELHIVGSGSRESSLQRQAGDLIEKGRVKFHGWQSDLSSFYQRDHAIVMTSKVEGFGMSLVEAMRYGCVPVVMDAEGGIRDIVTHSQNGYVVPHAEVETFARSLERLYRDPTEFRRLSLSAARSTERFAPERVYKQWQKHVLN